MNDFCPVCGKSVVVDSVTPDFSGWRAHCESGHPLYLIDLDSPPVLLEETHELA